MKYAADFRSIARDALKGKWGMAVVAGVIATLLGAVATGGPEFEFHFNDKNRIKIQSLHLLVSSECGEKEKKKFILKVSNSRYLKTSAEHLLQNSGQGV